MSWNSIKRDAADIAFSEYVRRTAKRCARCGKLGQGDKGITGLDASHFHSRGREPTRFDLENVDCICRSCHRWFGEHKTEYEAWKLKQLGQKKYDLLELRANTTMKKDREIQKIYWQQELRKLDIS